MRHRGSQRPDATRLGPFALLRPTTASGLLAAAFLIAVFLPIGSASALVADGSSSVGVFVETTLPPPTTAPPEAMIGAPTPEPTPTTVLTTDDSLAAALPPAPLEAREGGFIAAAKSAARMTGRLLREIVSGKAVADAIEAILPANVADVVVPAVRAASTFAFPIGLAAAVLAFLGLQQRIDQGDPKLSAAPIAHDDEVVAFR